MGQQANSGRNASLDNKKERAAGRDQHSPAQEAITGRQEKPPVAGAFGREGQANHPDAAGTPVTGESSGSAGGPATEDLDRDARTP